MKKIFLALFFTVSAFALDDKTVPNTFVDSAIIEAADFNQNFDTLEAWIARTNDSIDLKFIRFYDLNNHDSTIKYFNVDTIRSNPDIDSIKGPTYLSGKTTLDSVTVKRKGSFSLKISADYCVDEETVTATYQIIDSMVYINIPYTGGVNRGYCGLCCVSDANSLRLEPTTGSFPAEILTSQTTTVAQAMVYNAGDIFPGVVLIAPSLAYWTVATLRDGAGADVAGLDYIQAGFGSTVIKGLCAQTFVYKR